MCNAAVAGPVVIWPLQTLRMQHSPALQALQARGDAALGSDSGHNMELASNTGPGTRWSIHATMVWTSFLPISWIHMARDKKEV